MIKIETVERRIGAVVCSITAPLYWWMEFVNDYQQTVDMAMVEYPCEEFTLNDFSHENLDTGSLRCLMRTIGRLNNARYELENYKKLEEWKHHRSQIAGLLPMCYNQSRLVLVSHTTLENIYRSENHREIDEWIAFCRWIEEVLK